MYSREQSRYCREGPNTLVPKMPASPPTLASIGGAAGVRMLMCEIFEREVYCGENCKAASFTRVA